jgi:hypothetical protein
MNSKRYFSNIIDFIDIEEVKALFEIEPTYNRYSKKSHFTLAKEYAIRQGSVINYIFTQREQKYQDLRLIVKEQEVSLRA